MATSSPEPMGCLTAILSLFGVHLRPIGEQEYPYRQRDDFLSPAEFSFYRVLVSAVGNRAVICPKVNLSDIFFVSRPHENQSYRNKIDRKHVDFLLCNPQTMKPMLGIELDDSSHERQDRQTRDVFVNEVFQTAGLPLIRMPAQAGYNPNAVWSQIEPHLTVPTQLSSVPDSGPPNCPKCGIPMVIRTASKGNQIGQQFYGCQNYPRCREIDGG